MNLSPNNIYKYISHFTEMYDEKGNEVNPMPEDVSLTVMCDDGDGIGFAIDQPANDLGITALIAKKWIIHSELLKLMGL